MIKLSAKINQTRIKADHTATVSLATNLEVSEETFVELNDMYYKKEDVMLIILKKEDWLSFILSEAKRLVEE